MSIVMIARKNRIPRPYVASQEDMQTLPLPQASIEGLLPDGDVTQGRERTR